MDNIKKFDHKKCGAVAIKFSQWIIQIRINLNLENNDIINENKPDWLIKMESFYENCQIMMIIILKHYLIVNLMKILMINMI